jgi:hypothetical protein
LCITGRTVAHRVDFVAPPRDELLLSVGALQHLAGHRTSADAAHAPSVANHGVALSRRQWLMVRAAKERHAVAIEHDRQKCVVHPERMRRAHVVNEPLFAGQQIGQQRAHSRRHLAHLPDRQPRRRVRVEEQANVRRQATSLIGAPEIGEGVASTRCRQDVEGAGNAELQFLLGRLAIDAQVVRDCHVQPSRIDACAGELHQSAGDVDAQVLEYRCSPRFG